jgi:plasmid rolling circle replication initiator protein Rep
MHHTFDFDNSLSDMSSKDKPWDEHHAETDIIQGFYTQVVEFERYAERLLECAPLLRFGIVDVAESKQKAFKLKEAWFCRVRHCPVCQWRRSLLWRARMFNLLPDLVAAHEGARWVFVTFTVKNPDISDLRATLGAMNKAWNKLVQRKEFSSVLGWVRSTEVTKGKEDPNTAHPHFHALLMVRPSYFSGGSYVSHMRWRELWRDCGKLDYLPVVNAKVVKPLGGADLAKQVCETLKYSVKPSDMVIDADWFLELNRQCFKLRFMATGGALKGAFKPIDEASNDDLLHVNDKPEDDESEASKARIAFGWHKDTSRYLHRPDKDTIPE